MKTKDEIMALAGAYAEAAVEDMRAEHCIADLKIVQQLIDALHHAEAALSTALDEALAERDALKADAERYRWLKTNSYVGIATYPQPHEVWCLKLPNPRGCNTLDWAVDSAMKGTS